MLRIKEILSGKCPRCQNEKVFYSNGNIFQLKMPEMHERCPSCDWKYEKEPGYFFGAMIISYMLTVSEAVFMFTILQVFFFEELFDERMMYIIIPVLLLGTFTNYKLSRIIWIYIMFKPKDRIDDLKSLK